MMANSDKQQFAKLYGKISLHLTNNIQTHFFALKPSNNKKKMERNAIKIFFIGLLQLSRVKKLWKIIHLF